MYWAVAPRGASLIGYRSKLVVVQRTLPTHFILSIRERERERERESERERERERIDGILLS